MNKQILIVIISSMLLGMVIGIIYGFKWWFPSTLSFMVLIGLIWMFKDRNKLKEQNK